MPTKIDTAGITVGRFGFASDDAGQRLLFPHAESHDVAGKSGGVAFGAKDLALEQLEGHIDSLLWHAASASIGHAWLKDDSGRVNVTADRVEMPRGVRLVRAEHGVEIVSHHVTLADVAMTVTGPFSRAAKDGAPPPSPQPLAERLRFLDSLGGKLAVTVKVSLDLPVLGNRTLDQELALEIKEGSLDFRALDDSLNWLEGQFLDVRHEGNELMVTWRVPIVGRRHELITWQLDRDASAIAAFGRVPVRSLADFRLGEAPRHDKPEKAERDKDKKQRTILESFALAGIDVALSLLAPRSLDVAGGTIMFGGDDSPGMVDLEVKGDVADTGAGVVTGRIGSVDTTVKDLRFGPVTLTADRLCFDGLDHLEVTFDGFTPVTATVHANRVTATNLALRVG
nr:hypothetical protein [Kofleriaceae bacterium]